MVLVVLVIIVAVLVFNVGPDIAEWTHNNRQPVLTALAKVVAKRLQARGQDHVRTYYFVTFEFKNGERREYSVEGEHFGLLAEGDYGVLTFQGTRFHGFERA